MTKFLKRIFIGLKADAPTIAGARNSADVSTIAGASTVSLLLMFLALAYAFLAGFHTTDFDTGWHLATGRWVVQHHQVFTTDQFSYTARGAEWIYPPLPGVIFYLLYWLAGWKALSWLTAAACVATVGLTLRRDEPITNALAVIAVPAIAFRTVARADLFNTVLFAALLHVVWSYYRGRGARLWLIPVLMCLWANMHLGFVAGIGILVAYVGMEILEVVVKNPRPGQNQAEPGHPQGERLRAAWPWLVAGAVATLANPFGWRLYRGVFEQPLVSKAWNYLVGEFAGTPLGTVRGALDWRDPQMSYWWLMAVAVVAMVIAVVRRQIGPALLLAGAAWVSFSRVRFQAMFAVVVVMVAGAVLQEVLSEKCEVRSKKPVLWPVVAAAAVLALFTGIRAADLVTNRYYIRAAEVAEFGAGPTWWYPERAAQFVEREKLPGNMYNDFNVGAYLTWRLPQYPVYSDNRAIPFGTTLLFHQRALMQQPPDAASWQREADRWGINTIFLSAARYGGLGFPLPEFCASTQWAPVYLDEVAAVFVRNRPENAATIERLKINCATVTFTPHARTQAELFQFYGNTGAILYLLGRDAEALQSLDRAEQMAPYDAEVHLTKAQLFQAKGRLLEAEREYEVALQLKPTSVAWFALGLLLEQEKRWAEAAPAMEKAARLEVYPSGMWMHLGQLYLSTGRPQAALEAFERARKSSPFVGDAARFGAGFNAKVEDGEQRARGMMESGAR
ncbi:MAG: tetratricopeptide repeat protein [Terriglobales bacterium]